MPALLQYEMDLALGVIIGALFLGGLAPTRFIYSSVKDEQPRPLFDDVPALLGRLSCIGLGATILAEAVTGKVCAWCNNACALGSNLVVGEHTLQDAIASVCVLQGVLGLLRLETGTESLTEAEFALVFLVLLVATNLKSPAGRDLD